MYKFIIEGFTVNERRERMKKQARIASHKVSGCDDVVNLAIGQVFIEDPRTRQNIVRHLARREIVFGLKGFAGLVIWRDYGYSDGAGEIIITLRARILEVDSWIIDFVRETIKKAGWDIIQEEELIQIVKNSDDW